MILSLIVAHDDNRNIGINNELPWAFTPADMSWFVKNTKNKPVIMGRKTHESIGKILPNRTNIILTRDTSYRVEGAIVVHTPMAALEAASSSEECVVIGGSELYTMFLPIADKLYVTEFHAQFDDCDASFPPVPLNFVLQEESISEADEDNDYDLTFKIYTSFALPV